MTTITIPKKLTKGAELVVVPREEYEEYTHWRKAVETHPMFKPTKSELKDLETGRREYMSGKTMKLNEFKQKLGFRSKA